MNEKYKSWISFIIVSVILCIVLFCGLWYILGGNKKYRELLDKHNETIGEVRTLNTDLDNANSELEKYKLKTDRIISELNETISKNGETIKLLQNVRSEIEGANKKITEAVTGIQDILKEVRNN